MAVPAEESATDVPQMFTRRRTTIYGGREHRGSLFGVPDPEAEDPADPLSSSYQQNRQIQEVHHQEMLQRAKANIIAPAGVLAVHIKEGHIQNLDPDNQHEGKPLSVYLRISAGGSVRCTTLYERVYTPTSIIFDDMRHFALQISAKRNAPSNYFRMQLVTQDPNMPKRHLVLSTKEIHLYDIIKPLYSVERIALRHMEKLLAEIDTEFCFAYGTFGYGWSNQFENRQTEPKDQIAHSMFCRCAPPDGRRDKKHDVITAIPVSHPKFINFTEKVDLGSNLRDFAGEFRDDKWQSIDDPILLMSKTRKRMHAVQQQYAKQTSRHDRINFLRRMINGGFMARDTGSAAADFILPANSHIKRRQHTSEHTSDKDDTGTVHRGDINTVAGVVAAAPGVHRRKAPAQAPAPEPEEKEPPPQKLSLWSKVRRKATDTKPTIEASQETTEQTSEEIPPVSLTPADTGSTRQRAPSLFAGEDNYGLMLPTMPVSKPKQIRRMSMLQAAGQALKTMLGPLEEDTDTPPPLQIPRVMVTPETPVSSDDESD